MDLIEQLPSSNGFTAILVVVDCLTKQAIFILMHDTLLQHLLHLKPGEPLYEDGEQLVVPVDAQKLTLYYCLSSRKTFPGRLATSQQDGSHHRHLLHHLRRP